MVLWEVKQNWQAIISQTPQEKKKAGGRLKSIKLEMKKETL